MPIDPERLQHGRALIDGALGGAKPAASMAALLEALESASWPDYREGTKPNALLLALADVDSDLERLASTKAELQACQATRDSVQAEARTLAGQIASMGHALAVLEGKAALSLEAAPGERLDAQGRPIRSNANWRRLALAALAERDSAKAELTQVKVELVKATADLLRVRDRAQARANNAEKREADRMADSLIVAAESEERGELLAELVAILAAMPLESFWQWPDLAACYGKARRLGQEEPAERWTRLQAKIGRAANG